jgi:hypothetical protein
LQSVQVCVPAELINQLDAKLATQVDDTAVHLRAQTTFTPGAKLMDSVIKQLLDALLADDTLGAEYGWEV